MSFENASGSMVDLSRSSGETLWNSFHSRLSLCRSVDREEGVIESLGR